MVSRVVTLVGFACVLPWLDREFNEELTAHLDLLTEEYMS
jgi:hypothetical protein